MSIDLTSISPPMAALMASLIGAIATITASLINLSSAWKKQTKDQPASKKTKRGPVVAVWLLVAASAIGGFSLSQYLMEQSRKDAVALDAQVREKLDRLALVAARLEQSVPGTGTPESRLTREKAPAALADLESQSTVGLGKCVAGGDPATAECSEQQAQRVDLCAELHPLARVVEVQRFVREDGDARPWSELRLATGQSPRGGSFVGEASERKGPHGRMLCQTFAHWGGARLVRLLVIEKSAAPNDVPAAAPVADGARVTLTSNGG